MRDDPDDAALREGARRFDAGAWFEAHEAWEEGWRGAEGRRRALLQGLILAAAALLKREQGVARGSARLWARGRARLEEAGAAPFPSGLALDVAGLVEALDRALAGGGPAPRLGDRLRSGGSGAPPASATGSDTPG